MSHDPLLKAKLILASKSPRRRQLLENAGYEFEVMAPDPSVEASFSSTGDPPTVVRQLACAKAHHIAAKLSKHNRPWIVLAADTVADLQGQILSKPKDRRDARQMLQQLSGQQHWVHTGICLVSHEGRRLADVASSLLLMDPLADSDIQTYLDTGKWQGKAGGFGYQDGWDWLHVLQGEETNVVGLPMELLADRLAELNQST